MARMVSIENMETKENGEPVEILMYPSISDQALELATIEEVSD